MIFEPSLWRGFAMPLWFTNSRQDHFGGIVGWDQSNFSLGCGAISCRNLRFAAGSMKFAFLRCSFTSFVWMRKNSLWRSTANALVEYIRWCMTTFCRKFDNRSDVTVLYLKANGKILAVCLSRNFVTRYLSRAFYQIVPFLSYVY